MAAGFTMQYDLEEELYRLVAPDGGAGDPVEFGCPATVETGGQTYLACLDTDDDDEPEVVIPVRLLGAEQLMELVEVEFDLPKDGDDDEGDDEDEEDDAEDGEGVVVDTEDAEDGAAPVDGDGDKEG